MIYHYTHLSQENFFTHVLKICNEEYKTRFKKFSLTKPTSSNKLSPVHISQLEHSQFTHSLGKKNPKDTINTIDLSIIALLLYHHHAESEIPLLTIEQTAKSLGRKFDINSIPSTNGYSILNFEDLCRLGLSAEEANKIIQPLNDNQLEQLASFSNIRDKNYYIESNRLFHIEIIKNPNEQLTIYCRGAMYGSSSDRGEVYKRLLNQDSDILNTKIVEDIIEVLTKLSKNYIINTIIAHSLGGGNSDYLRKKLIINNPHNLNISLVMLDPLLLPNIQNKQFEELDLQGKTGIFLTPYYKDFPNSLTANTINFLNFEPQSMWLCFDVNEEQKTGQDLLLGAHHGVSKNMTLFIDGLLQLKHKIISEK